MLLAGAEIAVLERVAEEMTLTYTDDVAKGSLGIPLISVSLLVRPERYAHKEIAPFFDGLLPEGLTRERIATRLRLDPTDTFGLLREIGRDCAGALSIVPRVKRAPAEKSDVLWLDDQELADRIAELRDRPLADDPGAGIRISLAGVQDKMAVVVERERVGLPRGLTPSTHILKPASIERRGARGEKLAFPGLVANEAYGLELAARAGIVAARASGIRVAGEPALLVERFDRSRVDGKTERLHQEDFCQALRMPPRLKYEQSGGPGVGSFLLLLESWSTDVASDRDELLDRIGFNYLIGNADAHAKNFSLLYAPKGLRLAPAYDLVSTEVYKQLDRQMATAVNGMFDPNALQPLHWRKWFGVLSVSERRYSQRLADLADRVSAAIGPARAALKGQGLEDPILGAIDAIVIGRVKKLTALRGE